MPDAETELEYDLYYVKHLSLTVDCYIVLTTMFSWLNRRRAALPARATAAQ